MGCFLILSFKPVQNPFSVQLECHKRTYMILVLAELFENPYFAPKTSPTRQGYIEWEWSTQVAHAPFQPLERFNPLIYTQPGQQAQPLRHAHDQPLNPSSTPRLWVTVTWTTAPLPAGGWEKPVDPLGGEFSEPHYSRFSDDASRSYVSTPPRDWNLNGGRFKFCTGWTLFKVNFESETGVEFASSSSNLITRVGCRDANDLSTRRSTVELTISLRSRDLFFSLFLLYSM